MKFTLSWLKEHLDTDIQIDQLSEVLTAIGLEVEEIHNPADLLTAFTVAHVLEAAPHPDADKLQVLKVDTGSEILQVVCGAPNARAGLKGAFAPSGSVIPTNGLKLKPTKIRGVESNGMMCSERELGLGEDHNGIIDLPADAPVGSKYSNYMDLDDPLIEIAITPNHQDALGVRGIARDLAAAGVGTLKPLKQEKVDGSFPNPINIHIESSDVCPIFAGRYIRGVKNGPSPKWLQNKLTSIGLKPISTLVDITNYFTFDRARPLHVFDADKIKGDLTIRYAKDGEKLRALNESDYDLKDNCCVIADDNGVQSIGGIMGGEATGCQDETVNVYLECAYFHPIKTAMAGRALNIDSDARYRFERGVDPETVTTGIEEATRLILELCGGEASEVIIAGDMPAWQKTVILRPSRVKQLGGIDVSKQEIITILSDLHFKVSEQDDTLSVQIPSWRNDVDGEADLVEEVLRIYGFDKIPSTPLPQSSQAINTGLNPKQKRIQTMKRKAASLGLMEAVTWAFLSKEDAQAFTDINPKLVLDNPISADLSVMRPNLLANLIKASGRNVDRGNKNIALFEGGNQFRTDEADGQDYIIAAVRRGQSALKQWTHTPVDVDAYDVKADVEALLKSIGVSTENAQIVPEAPHWYHPGRSGVIRLGPKNIMAYFGEIHPSILKKLDVKGPLVAFEIMLDNIPYPQNQGGNNRGSLRVSDYQAVERDFAFVVDKDIDAAIIIKAAKGADKALIDRVMIFDIYEGANIGEDKKSVAFNIRLQPYDKTLTDEEIEAISQKVIKNVEKSTGGSLR